MYAEVCEVMAIDTVRGGGFCFHVAWQERVMGAEEIRACSSTGN